MAKPNVSSHPYTEGGLSVGFSAMTLLLTSIFGFLVIATVLKRLVLRSSNKGDVAFGCHHDGDVSTRTYNDGLENADVSTLNRAQRRARAKNYMKKHRRVVDHSHYDIVEEVPRDTASAAERHERVANRTYVVGEGPTFDKHQPSRNDRQRAAKAQEREKRRQYEEERTRQVRKFEQAEKTHRKQKVEQAFHTKMRLKDEYLKKEQSEYEQWKYMFPTATSVSRNRFGCSCSIITVRDFVKYMRHHKMINLNDIALELSIGTDVLRQRLEKLETEGRIPCGVFNDCGNYIYLTQEDMQYIEDYILGQDSGTSIVNITREFVRMINISI